MRLCEPSAPGGGGPRWSGRLRRRLRGTTALPDRQLPPEELAARASYVESFIDLAGRWWTATARRGRGNVTFGGLDATTDPRDVSVRETAASQPPATVEHTNFRPFRMPVVVAVRGSRPSSSRHAEADRQDPESCASSRGRRRLSVGASSIPATRRPATRCPRTIRSADPVADPLPGNLRPFRS